MKQKTPILILDNSYTFGGAINSLSYLLKALDRERFEPIVVSGQAEEFLAEHFPEMTCYHFLPKLPWVNKGIYVRLLTLPMFKLSSMRKLLNLFRFGYWAIFIHIPEAFKYAQIGRKHRVSLVHLNNILGSQLSGIIAAKILGVPCVAHMRDFEAVHPVTRFYARFISHHIAISKAIRENIFQLGVPEWKVTLVHDAIDLEMFKSEMNCDYLLDEFDLDNDNPRFGIFGRVIEWKGIREFVHAVKLIVEHFPKAKAFIVGGVSDGDKDFMQEIIDLVKSYDLERNIIITGYREDIPALMRCMDVLVHASIRPEPFGMILIEAMAVDRPVVATRAGGPLDIVVEDVTGYLVPMGDSKELAESMLKLFYDPELARQMGRQGQLHVQRYFTSKRYAADMETVYRQLIRRQERPEARVV